MLKIQIIKKNNFPTFLVLDDNIFYPIVSFYYKGKTNIKNPSLKEPFFLIEGTIFFQDINGLSHKIKHEDDSVKCNKKTWIFPSQEEIWANRLKKLDNYRSKNNLPVENNPLKRMGPWEWSNIPEEQWPDWKKQEVLELKNIIEQE